MVFFLAWNELHNHKRTHTLHTNFESIESSVKSSPFTNTEAMPIREKVSTIVTRDSVTGQTVELINSASTPVLEAMSVLESLPSVDPWNIQKKNAEKLCPLESANSKKNSQPVKAPPAAKITSFFTKKVSTTAASDNASPVKPPAIIGKNPGELFLEAVRYGEAKLLEKMKENGIHSPHTDDESENIKSSLLSEPAPMTELETKTADEKCVLQPRKKKALPISSTDPSNSNAKEICTVVETNITLKSNKRPAETEPGADPLQKQTPVSILKPRSKKNKISDPSNSTINITRPDQVDDAQMNLATITSISETPRTSSYSKDTQAETIVHVDQGSDRTPNSEEPSPSSIDTKDTNRNINLSADINGMLSQNASLRIKYTARLDELVQRVVLGTVEEEDPIASGLDSMEEEFSVLETAANETDNAFKFDDEWLPELAIQIQGSRLSLRSLTHKVYHRFREKNPSRMISLNTVMDKIKVIATRKQYLSPDKPLITKLDKFQDTNERFMWRWELTSLDLIPDSMKASVKKARANRLKLQGHHKAILRLLAVLDECDSSLSAVEPPSAEKRDEMIAKITDEEEKVLKFERENEKMRLLNESKVQKLKDKEQKQAEKVQEKVRAEDEKRQEKIRREEEKERKKLEAADAKRKKDEESMKTKEQAVEKQKARLMSFFKPSSPTRESKAPHAKDVNQSSVHLAPKNLVPSSSNTFSSTDSDEFWKCVEKGQHQAKGRLFPSLSLSAKNSRKRKTVMVSFTVFVRAVSENDFDNRVYDEEKTVMVRNKYKFLGFHEDYRPPYYGTWSKPLSRIITGRNPFGQDSSVLDYSYDSEAEWEEGEDEEGDDCSESGHGDEEVDEEGDDLDYQDGWLAQEDDIKYEDVEDQDDEAKALRRMKINAHLVTNFSKAYSIAPCPGGIPMDWDCPDLLPEILQGIGLTEAKQSFESHIVEVLLPSIVLSVDTFPPLVDVDEKNTDAELPKGSAATEMSEDNLRTFVKFVHNCTLKSKDTLIEELRTAHKDITSSRAQASRKLDAIATKKRTKTGVIWEVNSEILESLGLQTQVVADSSVSTVPTMTTSDFARNSPAKVTPAPQLGSSSSNIKLSEAPTAHEMNRLHTQTSVNLLPKFFERRH